MPRFRPECQAKRFPAMTVSIYEPVGRRGLYFSRSCSVRVLRDDGQEAKPNELGRIVIKQPLPPGTILTLWENDQLYSDLYFKSYPGYYDTADVGVKDEHGFITVLSRADDVINVAGHRLSSSALEEVGLVE